MDKGKLITWSSPEGVSQAAGDRPRGIIMQIPKELLKQFAEGNGTIFIGAGLSSAAGLPSWSMLIDGLTTELEGVPENASFPDIAQYYELVYGRHRLVEKIRELLSGVSIPSTSLHDQVTRLPTTEIFTTNFDNLLEQALKQAHLPFLSLVTGEDAAFWTSGAVKIIKLHGDLSQPSSLVITSADYEMYQSTHVALARLLQSTLHTRTVLFLGYSARDQNFRFLLRQVRYELGRYTRNLYALLFGVNKLHRLDLEARGLRVIDLELETNMSSPPKALGAWLDEFIQLMGYPRSPRVLPMPQTFTVEGESHRSEFIVETIERFIASVPSADPTATVRLRQGFGSFSVDDSDHPENQQYANLLQQEHDAFVNLFRRGYTFRVLISRRPLLAADLYEVSSAELLNWRKWHNRCQRLISFIISVISERAWDRFVCLYTPYTYLTDFSLGTYVLVKGTKTDSGPSYKATTATWDVVRIRGFIDEFEAHVRERLEDYTRELGLPSMNTLRPEQILEHTVLKLNEVREEIASRVDLLERALESK
jgi:SIR2-like protein